jgi:kynurenine 3-monooxygenase
MFVDWPPKSKEGVETIFTKQEKHVTTIVLPRDKLVGILVDFIETNYSDRVQLCFDYEVQPVDWGYRDGSSALLQIGRKSEASYESAFPSEQGDANVLPHNVSEVEARFLIAADGTVRTIANSIEKADAARLKLLSLRRLFGGSFHVRRYFDDNQRVYKSIPFRVPDGWRRDLDYSARTSDGRVIFDALPANSRGDYCGVLLLRRGDDMAKADVEPAAFRDFLNENLPPFSELIGDETVVNVAKKPVSFLPGFRYSGPRLHQGQCCVLLGDSAHTVKPYFGLGANSALEDVLVLSDAFDEAGTDLGAVARLYSKKRAKDAKTLVRLSRELDRPGSLGFLTFILPLILDSLFFSLAPKVFAPNMIRMLQREKYTFTEVARRKRIDRVMQVICLGTLAGVGYCFISTLFASRFALSRGLGALVTTLTRLSVKALQ